MFCPRCGTTQPDELNFCKSCGANLHSVRFALETRETGEKFDWTKTWLAEMMLSNEEKRVRRLARVKRSRGATSEMRRRTEIKAGVITASSGVGLTLALFMIMEGIIASGSVSAAAVAILSRIWIVGLIPILVGLALIFNGTFVSKKLAGGDHPETGSLAEGSDSGSNPEYLPPPDTNQISAGPSSVTDDTTRHLDKSLS